MAYQRSSPRGSEGYTLLSMIEIDFDKVQVGVADVPFYANDERPVRIPPYVAVKCLNPETCMDCGKDSQPRTGLTAWLAERDDERTPTAWVTLCEEHISSTKRRLPAFL